MHNSIGMQEENKNEINFEKTQSVIVNYIDFRKNMEFFTVTMMSIGIFLMVLSGYLVTLHAPLLVDGGIETIKAISIIAIIFGLGMCVVVFSGRFVLGFLHKRSETLKTIHSVHSNLIRKSYFINFELVSTIGNTRLEKLTHHLGLVFPEIQKVLKKLEKKRRTVAWLQKHQNFSKKINRLGNYNLVFKTTMGLFVIKIFDKTVTFEDIETIARQLRNHRITTKMIGGIQIERAIVLAKSYDDSFDASNLDKKMNSLKRDFNLDLILEENEYGYATIWID